MRWPKPSGCRRPYETRPERTRSKSQARDRLPTSLSEEVFKSPRKRARSSHISYAAQMADTGGKETNKIAIIIAGIGTEVVATTGIDAENEDPETRGGSLGARTNHEQGENMHDPGATASQPARAGRELGARMEQSGSAAGAGRDMEGTRGIVDGLRASGGASAQETDGGAGMLVREPSDHCRHVAVSVRTCPGNCTTLRKQGAMVSNSICFTSTAHMHVVHCWRSGVGASEGPVALKHWSLDPAAGPPPVAVMLFRRHCRHQAKAQRRT